MNLTALQDSAFLRSLGWAIANSLWQSAVLLSLYYIVIASYKNASSKFKNNISTVFLFSIFIWFTTTFITKLINLKNELVKGNEIDNDLMNNYLPLHQEKFNLTTFTNSALQALPYLSLAYLLLLLILLVKLINSYCNTSFIKNHGLLKPGVEWRLFTEKVTNQICLGKKVGIWLSEYVDVPATLGFFKPVILIPVASINLLSVQQLEAIILHELSHIKRNDYLVNLFMSIVETILFFNPFVVLLSKIIKKERENCCDDFVLQYQYDRHSYASALLFLEQSRNQNWNLALASTSGKKQLLSRIKRIMEVNSKTGNLNYGQKLLALLFITGIIVSIAWLSPEKKLNENIGNRISATSAISKKISLSNKQKNNIENLIPDGIYKPSKLKSEEVNKKNILKNDDTLQDYEEAYEELAKNNSDNLPFVSGSNEEPEYNAGNNFSNIDLENPAPLYNQYSPQPPLPGSPVKSSSLDKLPESYFPDKKIFSDFNIDIKQLEKSIEDANLSIASLDWNKINEQITFSLKSIKQSPEVVQVMKEINIRKVINDIIQVETDKKKQLQENLKVLLKLQISRNNESKEQLKKKAEFDKDLLHKKRTVLADTYYREINSDKIPSNNFEFKAGSNPIIKRKNSQNSPFALYNYNFKTNDKNNSADRMSLEFKDGTVYINGEKMNALNNKKIQAMFKAKKFVIAFDEDEQQTQTED